MLSFYSYSAVALQYVENGVVVLLLNIDVTVPRTFDLTHKLQRLLPIVETAVLAQFVVVIFWIAL